MAKMQCVRLYHPLYFLHDSFLYIPVLKLEREPQASLGLPA